MPHFKVKVPFDFAGAIKVMRANGNINIELACVIKWRRVKLGNNFTCVLSKS